VDGHAGLAASGLDLPETVTARTPSGGQHLFFRLPDGCGHVPSPVGLLPGVDIRADGTQVAVAPSQREYMPRLDVKDNPRWSEPYYLPYELTPGRLAMAPGGLLAVIHAGPVGRYGTDSSGRLRDELPDTASVLETGLMRGKRNSTMYRLACRWWRSMGVHREADVVARAYEVWAATADTGDFTWSEAHGAVMSAQRFVQRQMDEEAALQAGFITGVESWLNGGKGR